MAAVTPFWISAFLDFPTDSVDRATAFWAGVTGYSLSPRRGEHDEFATLLPNTGDDYLRVQRLATGQPRIHLDLHVRDLRAAADEAVDRGAVEVSGGPDQGYLVLTSPAGFTFCFVGHQASSVPEPARWPGGSISRVDQVCLDLPRSVHEQERQFWSDLLATPIQGLRSRDEFSSIAPGWSPLRVLVQRLEETEGPARAHLDLGVTGRAAETARHLELGATLVGEDTWWTVLADPAGLAYCLTDRSPS